ncbi:MULTISPECIES: hypothetical protein [Treponema]|uniref:hypothetical protein n=1 Tax=Treponema TaxID=157 RepID=UPI0002B4F84C|nr:MULTISPECIES: hypothetical protein [Treponema]EMB46682.1 hypothetical protein HMPREF9729_01078 [Treponema denticola ASLM]EMD58010.1 hypothetical protein HMPREF9728_00253 [Treponema denticola US-Trep]UTD11184.1 hypothetical protein HYB91_11860 [Treponema sp. B152]UTD13423.1 hypothetical protein HO345_10725 [Treponema denticola]
MKVNEKAYELLMDKLLQIENTASCGIIEDQGTESCLVIRSLVFDIRKIINDNFYVAGDDEPPAA